MKRIVLSAPVIAVCMLIGIPSTSASQDQGRLTDQQIQSTLEHKLSGKHISNVKVAVHNGDVVLTGVVPSAWAKAEAAELANDVDDVRAVTSDLTIARGESDHGIAQEVSRQLRRYVFYTIYDDVSVSVHDGSVTLTGRVTMPYKAHEMADLASRVNGVQAVKDQIETLPVSILDDQLRYEIARRIYRDPLFWNYGIQVNPPIHIIVENSRVTLTGVVSSEVERRAAEVIARSTFGVLGVQDRLTLENESH